MSSSEADTNSDNTDHRPFLAENASFVVDVCPKDEGSDLRSAGALLAVLEGPSMRLPTSGKQFVPPTRSRFEHE
jgi:hypothetical protein